MYFCESLWDSERSPETALKKRNKNSTTSSPVPTRPTSERSWRRSFSAWVTSPRMWKDRYIGKDANEESSETWAEKGKSLKIWNVFTPKPPPCFKTFRDIEETADHCIEPNPCRPEKSQAEDPHCRSWKSLPFLSFSKTKLIKVKEKRRLTIPILDAEKRRPRIIRTIPNATRKLFPSRDERRLRHPMNRFFCTAHEKRNNRYSAESPLTGILQSSFDWQTSRSQPVSPYPGWEFGGDRAEEF